KVIELRGGYKARTVPDGVLYLTMGVDVQRGSLKDKKNPARVEFEIMGMGGGYRTWSITYERIEGSIDNEYQGAWEKLFEFVQETKLKFKRADGYEFPVSIVFVDSGDGEFTDIVYRFCGRLSNTFPSKGFGNLKTRKKEKGDEVTASNFRRYRYAKVGEDAMIYEIATNYYKTLIYNNLKITRQPLEPQRPGFCDFPINYSDNYFKMLTAEEKHKDGSFHDNGRRNEALDCRVYAQCAADAWIDIQVNLARLKAKKNGAPIESLQQISKRTIIQVLKVKTKRREVKG
ncbi:phage terminase large subunit family protein, partial [bacterium]|nr:phage terminase large subunit family protein [bacterium]